MSLLSVGAFLGIVGACDLLRAGQDALRRWQIALSCGVGLLLIVLFLAWIGESFGKSLVLGGGWFLALVLWTVGSAGALRPGGRERATVFRGLAFGGIGLGLLGSVLCAGALELWPLWPERMSSTILARWPVQDVVIAGGAVVLQLVTGNLLVRLVLDVLGGPAERSEKGLTGGRLLGPMERILILGLGCIGQITAAAVLLATKGLLRLPGLRGGSDGVRGDATESLLVGSFASWLIGLAGVSMVYLG